MSTTVSFVLVTLVVAGGVGVYSMMRSGTGTGGEVTSNALTGLLIHVVNETSAQPVSGVPVYGGPVSSPDDIGPTWANTWTLDECVHGPAPSGSVVLANGTVALPNGTEITYPTCPLKSYTTNSTGWVSIPNAAGRYYFFNVGGLMGPDIYGFVPLSQGVVTQVTINWQIGDCQWRSNVPLATGSTWCG
jgi:hypothetical protein